MKKYISIFALFIVAFATSCKQDVTPQDKLTLSIEVPASSVDTVSAQVNVSQTMAENASYTITTDLGKAYTAEEILTNGKSFDVKSGKITLEGLTPDTQYKVVAAAEGLGEVVLSNEVIFKTLKPGEKPDDNRNRNLPNVSFSLIEAKETSVRYNMTTINVTQVKTITLTADAQTPAISDFESVSPISSSDINKTLEVTVSDLTPDTSFKVYALVSGLSTTFEDTTFIAQPFAYKTAKEGDKPSGERYIDNGPDLPSNVTTIFVPGVSEYSGWYDTNKKRDGQSDNDFNLCWACATANLLSWWEDYYTANGYELPEGTPQGVGSYYETAVFDDAIKPNWENRGGTTLLGIHWYFTGEYLAQNDQSGLSKPKDGTGGYLSSIYNDIVDDMGGGDVKWTGSYWGDEAYVMEQKCYYNWGGAREDKSISSLETFSKFVKKAVKEGAAGLDASVGASSLHAMTLWGIDVDNETGNVVALWFTDSDNQMRTPKEERKNMLHHYSITERKDDIYLVGFYTGAGTYITSIVPLKAYPAIK